MVPATKLPDTNTVTLAALKQMGPAYDEDTLPAAVEVARLNCGRSRRLTFPASPRAGLQAAHLRGPGESYSDERFCGWRARQCKVRPSYPRFLAWSRRC